MSLPLFSILVASYNNGKYLMDAINSVRKQSYPNWEIIIVDDGSTDNSSSIYSNLTLDDKISIFYNGENKGCAYTKHQCVLHANGEFCGFLDPDDAILPNAIEVTCNALINNPNAALTMSRQYLCDENLNILSESRKLVLNNGVSYFENHDYQAESFAGFRKESYIKMGGLNISCKAGVDADLYFRLEEQGQIVVLDEITYLYRRLEKSITNDVYKMYYWNIIIRHGVCLRRGLPIEDFSLLDFKNIINDFISIRLQQENTALQSKAYKLGKAILFPVKKIIKIFNR